MQQGAIHAAIEKVLPAAIPRFAVPAAIRLLALDRIESTYEDLRLQSGSEPIPEKLLRQLEVEYRLPEDDLAKIPAEGPAIVIANHPYGMLEGAVLSALLLRRRKDVKFFANNLLGLIPELASLLIPLDLSGGRRNQSGVRQALAQLSAGGLLVVFPAGEVAHLNIRSASVADPAWRDGVVRLLEAAARRGRAPAVVPIHIAGRNGALFQVAGLIHPTLRTALLPRELLNKRRAVVELRIGTPIDAAHVLSIPTIAERIHYLRWRTEVLGRRPRFKVHTRKAPRAGKEPAVRPIAPPTPAGLVAEDVAALDDRCILASSGDLRVYLARAAQLPHALREIGRLREIAFRAEGEGTGRPLDLDRFDLHYRHLFLWNSRKREIAGAYRLAMTAETVRDRGIEGLYTATLFRFGDEFLARLGPAIELGRSFIHPEYQRSFSALLLLWKGIGRFVADRPECKSLFGPVSVSNRYQAVSRELIIRFFERCSLLDGWKGLVRARNAPPRPRVPELCRDFEDLTSVVADLEPDRAGVPVLLRQYVKLGGRLLGFNVDPEFTGALDGLILVDLTRTEVKLLERYLGRDAAARFLAYHGATHGTH